MPIPDEPLGLTVHSLPNADTSLARGEASTRSGRWKMLFLLAVCAAPVVASYFTYYVLRPEGRRNYGELIDPQRPLPALTATDMAGRPSTLSELKDQWLLISVGPSGCPEACQNHLYLQRQMREAMGKDKERLDWVWLRTDDQPVQASLLSALDTATVLRVSPEALAEWLEAADGARLEDHLYVVDPIGNWMMRFPAQIDPKQARRDMERLLRASAFWDQAGRPTPAKPQQGSGS